MDAISNGSVVAVIAANTDGLKNSTAQPSRREAVKEIVSPDNALAILQESVRMTGACGVNLRAWQTWQGDNQIVLVAVIGARICGYCGNWHLDNYICAKEQ